MSITKPVQKMVLVTGAAGYIGSHTCIALIEAGYEIVALDNLCNSSQESLARVTRITGQSVPFINGDIRDRRLLQSVFARYQISSVIHFAGLKAVGESVANPLKYFDNNVSGTVALLQAMETAGVRELVFSSSATVYGDAQSQPIAEDAPLSTTNPYGASKLVVENILRDLLKGEARWRAGILRYFNPVGAHPSGLLGEDPRGVPNNLMPYVAQVAVGKREQLSVFGADYPTPDGTGVRDYIHVVDLARGHVAALGRVHHGDSFTVNLGTGQGYSVLELIAAFERASGRRVPYQIAPRRPGDVARCYANPRKAQEILGWKAERTLDEMCADHWRWQHANPEGFARPEPQVARRSTPMQERRVSAAAEAAALARFGERRSNRRTAQMTGSASMRD